MQSPPPLAEWARSLLHIHALLLAAQAACQQGDRAEAQQRVGQALRTNWALLSVLGEHGAPDLVAERLEPLVSLPERRDHSGGPDTLARQRYRAAVRAAYEAYVAVQAEASGVADG